METNDSKTITDRIKQILVQSQIHKLHAIIHSIWIYASSILRHVLFLSPPHPPSKQALSVQWADPVCVLPSWSPLDTFFGCRFSADQMRPVYSYCHYCSLGGYVDHVGALTDDFITDKFIDAKYLNVSECVELRRGRCPAVNGH